VRGVLNVEGIFALAWLAVALWRSRAMMPVEGVNDARWRWCLLLAPVPFLPFLAFPFLADDYVHILHAREFTLGGVSALFTVPAADRFFRPLGYLAYALDTHWAGWSPLFWRAGSLALHLANVALVYHLCRRLEFRSAPAIYAALLFAVHGSRPESVTWVAARFDLLAVFFGMICLLAILNGRSAWALLALLAAVLSKESAFVVPLLAVALLWYTGGHWRTALRRALPLFAVAISVFAYRWWLLGGVGGYHNAADGSPTVFHFKFTSTLQALFPRFWGTLLFPLNWSTRPSFALYALMGACVIALLWLAIGRASRRPLILGIAIAYICALPVHQFLSIGADLEKSRVLYFPSVGLAIVFASLITSRWLLFPAGVVLLFQFAALEHNLVIWQRVGYEARAACRAGAKDLPNVRDGVYFLHTGYPECLEFP
jgi:hypothetical protein